MPERKCTCEGDPCVCEELEQFVAQAEKMRVRPSAKIEADMFEVGTGQALDGQLVLVLYFQHPNDPSVTLPAAFTQEAAHKLLALGIKAYGELWQRG